MEFFDILQVIAAWGLLGGLVGSVTWGLVINGKELLESLQGSPDRDSRTN